MILNAVADDDEQGEDEEDVRGHRNIGKVLERAQPADRDQHKCCHHYVQAFHVALVLLRLKANHLVHLLADKYQVSDGEAQLTRHDVKVDEFAASGA